MDRERELKQAVDRLGIRLREALEQDDEVIRLVHTIQRHGMNLTVILEAHPAEEEPEPDAFSDFDRRFLRNLRIQLADDTDDLADGSDS